MGRLDEVLEILASTSDELREEGVNTLDYWLARCNIESEEYYAWMQELLLAVIHQPEFDQMPKHKQIMSIATHAFLAGLILGREKKENEF